MMRGLALAAAMLVLAPVDAQPSDGARRELSAARAAAGRAQAAAHRLDAAAAEADARVVAARRTVRALDRALAQSDLALAAARHRLDRARVASAASDAAIGRVRAPLAALIAALVRRERQPSALLLTTAATPAETLRLRATLAAVAPAIDARTAALRRVVEQVAARRYAAAEAVAEVGTEQRRCDRQRGQLRLAIAEEARRRDGARADAEGARQQAEGLIEQAGALDALLVRLGRQDSARARLAAMPGPELRPGTAAAPARQVRAYRMPASGRLLAGMGETSTNEVRTRGLLLATTARTIVRAPAAGRIAYAGPFRAWGAIMIVDHGHGWTTLVAGLDAIDRRSGGTVAQGDPLGRSGARLLIELRHRGRPIDVAAMAQASM